MGEDTRTSSTALADTQDPEQIRHEIDETRRQLGETVAALAEKTDVAAQAKRKARETKASVQQKRRDALSGVKQASPQSAVTATSRLSESTRKNPVPLAVFGAFAAGVLLGKAAGGQR